MIRSYAAQLPKLQAREQLSRIQAAVVPHLKGQAATEIVEALKEQAGRERARGIRPSEAQLQALGIQVVRQSPDGEVSNV